MGAYAPLPWLPEGGVQRIVDEVCIPVAKQMAEDGVPYSGLLYAGLAWTSNGPEVIEFNCRFGDPETQPVLQLLDTPLAGVLNAVATGTLAELPPLQWKDGYALTVARRGGLPGVREEGWVITGAEAGSETAVSALLAWPRRTACSSPRVAVAHVVGEGATLEEARGKAYATLATIDLPGGHFRKDIALAAVEGKITVPGEGQA